MDEPSVLDFVLEKLTFWRESKVTIPSAEEEQQPPDSGSVGEQRIKHIWRKILIFLPPLFAITAQVFSEPANRSQALVIFFYISAAGSLLLLIIFRDWQIEPLILEKEEAGIFTVHWVLFGIGCAFGILAFLLFLGNRFTGINVSLWVIALVLIWRSLWKPEGWWGKLESAWKRFWESGIQITPWSLLVAGVFVLAGFYRFYLLDQVFESPLKYGGGSGTLL